MKVNTVGDAFRIIDKTPLGEATEYVLELPEVYILGLDVDADLGPLVPAIDRRNGKLIEYGILSDISAYQNAIKKHRSVANRQNGGSH